MLTDEQRAHLEQRLLEERAKAAEAAAELAQDIAQPVGTSDGDLSKYPTHLADLASDTAERERDRLLSEHQVGLLEAIDAALTLLRENPEAYGRSRVSGESIPFERLDIMPWTRVRSEEADEETELRSP